MASRLMWRFDRIFGDSRKVGSQVVFIAIFLVLLIAIATVVGMSLNTRQPDTGDRSVPEQTIGLILNIYSLTYAGSTLPLWWRAMLSLLSVMVFTAFAVTFIANYVGNRVQAYRTGTVRYYFKGHLLFFGGGAMLPAMLKKVWEDPALRRRHIVILTATEVADVRRAIDSTLTSAERKMKITVLRGNLDDAKAVESVFARNARRLYIVGDHPDMGDYDSVNIACWNEVRRQCAGRVDIPCFLLLEHASSTRILQRRESEPQDVLDTTIVWRPEAIAQRVLMPSAEETRYPLLDRRGIGYDSQRTVHLVLYGMTSFAQAMAVTAAQLCHFPNFVRDNTLRTRITFIAPGIQRQSEAFCASGSHLFSMSHVKCPWREQAVAPADDFLDTEWEFVEGTLEDEGVREALCDYYRDSREGRTYLTLAVCGQDAHDNIASALYLPDEFHRVVYAEGGVDWEATVPIYVYQPDSEELLRVAGSEIPMYANIIPVGSVRDSYDPSIRRRVEEGKRINYIYSCGPSYSGMTDDQEQLDRLWHTSFSNRMSSIYCACHSGVKQRSMAGREMTEAFLEVMARVEHNRWNMEKLLSGYATVSAEERGRLKQYETQGDTEGLQALEKALKQRKAGFEHYCIAPYDELLEHLKDYDILIARSFNDINMNKTRTHGKKL